MSSSNYPTALDTVTNLFTAVNGISTVLSSAIDNIVATIPVTDTTFFPSAGYIVIDQEIIQYTGKTGISFTGCTRGADGSTAASHLSAAVVSAYAVADHHNILVSAIIAMQTLLGNSSQDLDLTARTSLGIKMKNANGAIYRIFIDADGTLAMTQL